MDDELTALRKELTRVHEVLGTLIAWLAQSGAAPISPDEAGRLIAKLDADD